MLVNARALRLLATAPHCVLITALVAVLAAVSSAAQWVGIALVVFWGLSGSEPAGSNQPGGISVTMPVLVAALVGVVVLRAVLVWLRDVCSVWTSSVIKDRLRAQLLDRLFALGPGHLTSARSGSIQQLITEGVENLDAYVGFYLPQAVACTVVPTALVMVLTGLWWPVGVVVAIAIAMVLFARQLWQRVLGERAGAHWVLYSRFAARIQDTLQGMTTVKGHGASQRFGDQLADDAATLYRSTMRSLRAGMAIYLITGLFGGLGTAIATAVGVIGFGQGAVTVLGLLVIMTLSVDCFRPVAELQNYWHEGFGGLAALRQLDVLLATQPSVAEGPWRAARADLGDTAMSITFDDVDFTYPGSDHPALHQLSLEVAAGSTVAVVGRSGAGKSTVLALAMRLFDPDRGRVLVGGVSTTALSPADVRSCFSVVSQDTYLFHDTIAANLRMAAPQASDSELQAAARAAGIHDTIAGWTAGNDTVVGERGARLSGGERQRVAIARALLHDAPILVLDEATSSVDSHTEALLQRTLADLRRNRTTLIVAHRLSTIRAADLIVVLDEGRVVESGTAAELNRLDGRWVDLTGRPSERVGAVR